MVPPRITAFARLARPDEWASWGSLRTDRGMDQRGRATRAIAVRWCPLRQLRGRGAGRVGCAGVLGSLGPTPLSVDPRDAARPARMAPRSGVRLPPNSRRRHHRSSRLVRGRRPAAGGSRGALHGGPGRSTHSATRLGPGCRCHPDEPKLRPVRTIAKTSSGGNATDAAPRAHRCRRSGGTVLSAQRGSSAAAVRAISDGRPLRGPHPAPTYGSPRAHLDPRSLLLTAMGAAPGRARGRLLPRCRGCPHGPVPRPGVTAELIHDAIRRWQASDTPQRPL